ncbi:MAG TPA: hypothetical protein P5137_17130, partial [Candidatus Brocadiia bacterium]|nr:hypothetical protein [Candidatus Brocadiia bacterium]
PAWEGALIHTEIRDGTNLCFHDHDKAAYKAFAGVDIPAEAVSKGGLPYGRIKGFPASRIVPDDHPILKFYQWFWTVGDGWNNLHTQVHRGLKTATQPGFWTFFDPAVRCPPIWGSGGEVDVISQWTYTYPDPPKMGQAADELFAMADGRPGQRVMKMTQVIWYRSGTAPSLPKNKEDYTEWEKNIPDAKFITIAPDHLSEAFWFKLSRPVQGIMYHGWGSLVEAQHGSYRYTNPQTSKRLAALIREVALPLGATLIQIPDRGTDVALLESFASNVFGSRGTWGWGGAWAANAHIMLQWARMQPRIVYEETILRDGLDNFKVLVMPDCDVLPQSVADRIRAWQRKGGVIVGDENLAPGLTPDVLIRKLDRKGPPDKDKAALQAMAEQVRQELSAVVTWFADSSSPDAIVRVRTYKDTDYLFAVNDKRTYGDYVGQHRKVMEKGLPLDAKVSIRRKGVWVYDLLASRLVDAKPSGEGVEWAVSFGPGEGRLFMVSPKPVGGVKVEIASRQPQERKAAVKVTVADRDGKPLAAVAPVKVEILDPEGKPAEFSGHYGAKDGVVELALDLAANDAAGTWTVKAVELASGAKAEAQFAYRK